eukprot:g5264.t1
MQCRICFDTPTNARVTPCGHVFCESHINEWLNADNKTCPVCRQPVRKALLVELFVDSGADSSRQSGSKAAVAAKEAAKDLRDSGEPDTVSKVLAVVQESWRAHMVEKTRLRQRVFALEDENKRLKGQLQAALVELDRIALRKSRRRTRGEAVDEGKKSMEMEDEDVGVRRGDAGAAAAADDEEDDDEPLVRADGEQSKVEEGVYGKSALRSSEMYDTSCPEDLELEMLGPWALEAAYTTHSGPVHGIDCHAFRPWVASASWDNSCHIHNAAGEGGLVAELRDHHTKGLYAVRFCPTQPSIVGTVSSDRTCRLWRVLDEGSSAHMFALENEHADEINSLAFHPFADVLATASDDRSIVLWDMATGRASRRLLGHRNSVYGLAYRPTEANPLIASVSFDWVTMIWDPRSGSKVRALEGHQDDIIGVDFAPGGVALATGSDDGTARIWDCRMWRSTAVLAKHEGEVKRVRFGPFGGALLTTSGDCTAKIWDMRSFRCTATLDGHQDHVFDAAWLSDGKGVVTASHDHQWRLWKPVAL